MSISFIRPTASLGNVMFIGNTRSGLCGSCNVCNLRYYFKYAVKTANMQER